MLPSTLMVPLLFFPFGQVPSSGGRELQILAQVQNPRLVIAEGARLVLRSKEDWQQWAKDSAVQARLAEELGIDWKKHMVLVVSGRRQPDTAKVEITSLTVRANVLEANWKVTPGRGALFTHPCVVVCAERFDGPIRFLCSDEVTFRTIAQGVYSGAFTKPERHHLTTEAEWIKLWGRVQSNLGTDVSTDRPKVDFSREQVIAVFRGKIRTIQPSIRIERLERVGTHLVASYAEMDRGGTDETSNSPFQIVSFPGRASSVIFERIESKR